MKMKLAHSTTDPALDSVLTELVDRAQSMLLYRDSGSRGLIWSAHDNTRVVRWVLREYGVSLSGPPPAALLDPLPVSELRTEVLETMREWAEEIFTGQDSI